MDVLRFCVAALLGSAGFYLFTTATLELLRTAVINYAARLLVQDHGGDVRIHTEGL